LKKENAYKGYIKAIKQQKESQFKNWGNYINILTIDSLIGCFKYNCHIPYLIDNSFNWASTKEGRDFWSALHNKWFEKMKDIELVAEKLTNN